MSDTNLQQIQHTGETVSGHELPLMDALKKIGEQDERSKMLEEIVRIYEHFKYKQDLEN
jgi:hypothetical protein